MRIAALTLAAGLVLAACAPTAAPTASAPPSAQAQAAACTAKGGAMQPVGKAQIPVCVIPYADAGKACTDKSQCEGQCVLEGNLEAQGPVTGACQKTNRQFGCYARVVNGKATAAICVD